jgi:uncharacterized protein (DUF2141 family)
MSRALPAAAAVLLLALAPGAALAARIVVTVDGLHSDKGSLYVALFARAEGFPDGDLAAQHLQVKAGRDPITVTFEAPPGRYALGAYHDENGNAKLDTNLLGYPIEGYALSNGIRAVLSRPRFSDAVFAVGDGETRVTLHIQY